MYRKGVAVEIQFAPERLNDGAGDPYWIDLSVDEATALLNTLQTRLAAHADGTAAPLVVTLDEPTSAYTPLAAAHGDAAATPLAAENGGFRQWVCVICGWVYEEAAGAPDHGLSPGTRWEDVPDDWRCPLCDVGKADFALVEF